MPSKVPGGGDGGVGECVFVARWPWVGGSHDEAREEAAPQSTEATTVEKGRERQRAVINNYVV